MPITYPPTRQTKPNPRFSTTDLPGLVHGSAELGRLASSGDEEGSDLGIWGYSGNPRNPRYPRYRGYRGYRGHPAAEEIPDTEMVGKALKHVIINQRKGLQKMYGETEAELDESLKTPVKKGEEMARKLIMEMGCSGETAIDLTVLTLYDVAILISMS